MRQVLLRAIYLLRRPLVLLVAAVLAGGGSALVVLPLFGLPGYELGLALAVGVGLLGGGIGIAAASLERRMIQGRDPRPRSALRSDSALKSAFLAVGAALTLNLAVLVPPFVTSLVFALVSTRCDPLAQVAFFPLLAVPSAVIASAAGVLCGFSARRGLIAVLLYAALVLASAAVTAWPILFGPQVFAFNHFAGYVPGPIYDEALAVTPGLVWYRVQTLLLACFLWLLCAFFLDMVEGRIRRPHFRPGALVLLAAIGLCVFAIEERASALRIRMTDAYVMEKLGGLRETEHFSLVYPRGKPREEVERLVRDLELRHAQLTAFFGQAPTERLRVFLYRSAEEKQSLVGAGRTQFAKPWRLELHINDAPFPHPVLKHELAHVMAAPFGTGPFRMAARFGVWPNAGVIEGIAVAGDDPVDELTLHEWSAGMRKQKLMPDIRALLEPQGFYRAPASRAYTAAGSFLRYLAEKHGPEKLRALYAHGDFAASYGRSLGELASEWEAFLDALPLDEAAVNVAFARFRRGSLFARPCAREVAQLSSQAGEHLRSDPERAIELYRRCAEVQPDEPSFRMGEAAALVEAGKLGEAFEVLHQLAGRSAEHPAVDAEVTMAQADLAFARERPEEARGHLERLLTLKSSQASERTARVKLAAIDSPAVGPAVWAYFKSKHEDVKLLVLREALGAEPKNPFVSYLLGRRLTSVAPKLAVGYLATALSGELPDSLRREALRLQVQAEYLSGDCQAVRTTVGQLPDYGAAFRAAANEWLERCDFEERAFKGPLVPEGPFR